MEIKIDKNVKISAGLMIMYDDKLLLGHPTGHSWWNTYTIPKGQVEKNESYIDAAIRETYEEVGLLINKNQILHGPAVIQYKSLIDVVYKQIVYFQVTLDTLPDIFDKNLKIKKEHLQLEEIDWAGFISREEAEKRIFFRQQEILDKANFGPIKFV